MVGRAAYKSRYIVRVQLNITFGLPVEVHIELYAIFKSPGGFEVGQAQRDSTEVDLDEVQSRKWTGKHRLEHRLHDLFDHFAGRYVDVGP